MISTQINSIQTYLGSHWGLGIFRLPSNPRLKSSYLPTHISSCPRTEWVLQAILRRLEWRVLQNRIRTCMVHSGGPKSKVWKFRSFFTSHVRPLWLLESIRTDLDSSCHSTQENTLVCCRSMHRSWDIQGFVKVEKWHFSTPNHIIPWICLWAVLRALRYLS